MPGSAESYISSVSHDDAASAVVAALGLPAGIYNVVDDEPLRRREYFELARRRPGRQAAPAPAWLVQVCHGFAG